MLLLLVEHLLRAYSGLENLAGLERVTLRAALAALVSFLLAVVLGPRWIGWLQRRFREPIKSPSAEVARLHQQKQFTPTMGGLFILAGLVTTAILFADLGNAYTWIALLLFVLLGALGAYDDWVKLSTTARGLSARVKLLGQVAIALAAAVAIGTIDGLATTTRELTVPVVGSSLTIGWWFVPLAVLVIVGSSNAVNLTDGLDGLAGGCLVCAGGAMAVVVYASGHTEWADYLRIEHISGAGELAIVAAAMIGSVLGFLWFNCHPASVFMGDTGSLPLGGLLGLLAVVARQELLLVAIGGVFVAEALSVIVQVVSFRWRRQRVFLCAPVHHHFQFQGWPEDKIVVRFWIAAMLCAILGLAGLKRQAAAAADDSAAQAMHKHVAGARNGRESAIHASRELVDNYGTSATQSEPIDPVQLPR